MSEPAKVLNDVPLDGRWTRSAVVLEQKLWLIGCAAITAIAAFLRFYHLELKPLHHDEGVNGWFLTNLFREGVYKYDPANYHGPTLYYIALGFVQVFGLDTLPIRWSVAVWGVAIVVLAFYLRRYIGRTSALFAGLFLALSPGMVYISRYFIHEIFFVFLSLGFVLAVLKFIDRDRAGPGAIFWLSLVLFVCFVPPAMYLPSAVAGENAAALWALRGGLLLVEGLLIFFIVRMLLEWNGGRAIYLILAAACVALYFATKETAFITLVTMAIACVCVRGRERITAAAAEDRFPVRIFGVAAGAAVLLAIAIAYKLPEIAVDFGKRTHELIGGPSAESTSKLFYAAIVALPALIVYFAYFWDRREGAAGRSETTLEQPTFAAFRKAVGNGTDRVLLFSACAAVLIYLIVLFFSSFFTYADGVNGFFEAYKIWLKTGSKDHTQNGIWAYVEWGVQSDGPVMVLSLVGAGIALAKGRDRVAMFVALWAFGLFAAYTIIPYKTPWLALSFLLPMCIIAGYAIGELLRSKVNSLRAIGWIAACAATAVLAYQAYVLNFVRYDDEDAPMVYAHTQREFLDMVRDIEHFAEVSGKGRETAIDVVSPDYWPLVWYMRDYPKAIFHGRIADTNPPPEMIVAKKGEQDNDVMRKYSANYEYYASYELRSGVELVLLVRRDLVAKR